MDGVSFTLPVTAGVDHQLTLELSLLENTGAGTSVQVRAFQNDEWEILASSELRMGMQFLKFRPSVAAQVELVFVGPVRASVVQVCLEKWTLVQDQVLVDVCDGDKDRYRFGYGNHEKINEISGIGNTIDMGDRWLDTRLGRTPKTDLHESKYPFFSPYSYAANSPIAFHDPDGKDYRLSIVKNNQGKTVMVTAHATVYLQGAGASEAMENKLNKEFNSKYAGFRKVDGVNVAFDVTYVYDKGKLKNEGNLRNGQNIFNVRTDLEKDYRSEVYGTQDRKGTKFYTGNKGTINNKSPNLTKTIIHETLHFMGLSDRYDNFNNNLYKGVETHKDFEEDIMGGGEKISDVHYENLLNHSKTKNQNYTIQDNERYDRASQSELKNGNKPNSQYHERSTQAQEK